MLITADGGGNGDIYPLTLGVMYQGDKEKMSMIMKGIISNMANVQSHTNTFAANKFEKAKEFLEKQGFLIQEESVSKYMNKLICVPEDKEAALKAALGKIQMWTMTIDKKDDISTNEEKQVNYSSEFN